jgi:hypothetical protein
LIHEDDRTMDPLAQLSAQHMWIRPGIVTPIAEEDVLGRRTRQVSLLSMRATVAVAAGNYLSAPLGE